MKYARHFYTKNKGASARLATYGLRLAMPGGSVLPRKAANLTDQSFRRR